MYSGLFSHYSTSTYNNNISNSDQFGTENSNHENIDMETVFVGSGSTDGQWQLTDDSPAIGAGINGEDCGMFGGNTPYKLSGIPSEIPVIYELNVPPSGFNMSIELKAKSVD